MEWISVKERLPDKGADVLMWFESNMAVGFWHDTDKDHTFWCAFTDEGYYTDCDSEPTYWMPLPELPNERTDCEADVEEYAEMTIEAAIKHCEEVSRRSPCTPCEREHMRLAAWLTELISLRAQHEQPNEPLTLEELREMDGEKIHIRCIGHCKNFYEDETAAYFGKNEQYIQHYNGMLRACDLPLQYYGEEWLAYRRKPEKEDDRND